MLRLGLCGAIASKGSQRETVSLPVFLASCLFFVVACVLGSVHFEEAAKQKQKQGFCGKPIGLVDIRLFYYRGPKAAFMYLDLAWRLRVGAPMELRQGGLSGDRSDRSLLQQRLFAVTRFGMH